MYGRSGLLLRSNCVPIEWSGLGPEFLLQLDRASAAPLRLQLEHGVRAAIRSGRLAAGERLPSSRELARELRVSRGLVQECYSQLQAEGFLSTRTGPRPAWPQARASCRRRQPRAARAPRLTVDFRTGVPDLASFPRRDWAWALREVSRAAPADTLDYGDPRGSEQLREVLAAYLRRVRGAVADPDSIVICTGFAQGLNLLLRALARAGAQRVAFENPGAACTASSAGGWMPTPVAVDERGVDVPALAATEARAVLLTPAHQWPTGVVLAPERRQALVDWASERDAAIIEDDYDAEFRYDREPVGALQGLAPDRVAALGTVSKSLAPALRLGWIVCPPQLIDAVAEEKDLDDRGSPGFDQLALARLIESGRFDRHLRRMRGIYAARRKVLIEALARHAPEVELRGLAAGFHAVAQPPRRPRRAGGRRGSPYALDRPVPHEPLPRNQRRPPTPARTGLRQPH